MTSIFDEKDDLPRSRGARDLAKRLIDASGDQRAGTYLAQKISIAIQRGNAASLPIDCDADDFHDAF